MKTHLKLGLLIAVIFTSALGLVSRSVAAEAVPLSDGIRSLLTPLSGANEFSLAADVVVTDGNKQHHVTLQLNRLDEESFDLSLKHRDYAVKIRRRADRTEFILPKHDRAFVGSGKVEGSDTLRPEGVVGRLVGKTTTVSTYLPLVAKSDPDVLSLLLTGLLKLKYDPQAKSWTDGDGLSIQFAQPGSVEVHASNVRVKVQSNATTSELGEWIPKDFEVVEIDRTELERQLARGVGRALEILAPAPILTSPDQTNRRVPHGTLNWVEGQRVVSLWGTPEQIGTAHGKLMKSEALSCIDSVLYTFGTAQTINSGQWFRHDLEAAYQRLSPYIPEDHKRETAALAKSLGIDEGLAQTINVFPELFHCSGFALFGTATKDGKLYHGRVLDYMTTIGLQDSATTFIVSVEGKYAFANVGYAGFIGSVSGMNSEAISLGEMGGRGEGNWDGVPMATLMRRALEECSTLDDVIKLWKTSPRTCEYYYVFADGKTNRAVGVAATPESIEFIQPGQSHERLGEGIKDAVVLSAGSRLEKLRERVQEKHGEVDADVGKWLMSRPVAMSSNLHNVLFVPEDGILYVANADHQRPAAERPYVKLDLNQLLKAIAQESSATAAP
jgi:hypothetical protein